MTRRPCLFPSIVQALRMARVLLLLLAAAVPAGLRAQVAGQNINMVSGTKWPGGDPFLQRQNEPSLAVSSRNPLHLLAGANDYRTVDLPTEPGSIPGTLSGDAWLGVFKSFDGGLSWQSTLLPGYPQDKAAGSAGLTSPLKAYSAAADPTVRAGSAGLFYYSGIVFNRGTNIGAVFVSRFYDLNNKENGDATDPSQSKDSIAFVDTKIIDSGTSGQFIDKPWIAVDQPRGATTCSIPVGGGVPIPAGNVYMVWSRFTGSTSTKIMFSRSTDCGKSWSNPTKLSESNSINQGTNVAVDPVTGNVVACWRRFATSSAPDAILCALSTDLGNTFPSKNTSTVANLGTGAAPNLWAFDQGSSGAQFRTNALPTMAISVDTSMTPPSQINVAWAARPSATGDARIYVSTSTNGLTWTAPVPADGLGISDDFGTTLTRGHQFMPQLTFSQGRLMLLYYDQRLDHTLGIAYPTLGFPDTSGPNAGKFYLFKRDPRGELLTCDLTSNPPPPCPVYKPTIADSIPPLSVRRHTIDLRVASRRPSDASFTATTVSQYKYGLRVDPLGNFVDETGTIVGSLSSPPPLSQIQTNAPNLPLFAQGTVPFLGDYIDIAGPAFVPGGPYGWIFNTAPANAPVFYATWTDNRDVIPPADGDWTKYTPVGGGGTSVLDPAQTTPPCDPLHPGRAGMRNQNIYVSRVSDGLLVGSLQNIKPLSAQKRAFVVTLQNLTAQDRIFRMTATSPNGDVNASFLPGSTQTTMEVKVGARLGASRPVFATSSTLAGTIVVNVVEITGPGGLPVSPNPLQGSVILNPEGSAAQLVQPDNAPRLADGEIYTPSLSLINILNTNPFINILNANQNINILNTTTGNVGISNPDPAIINILNQNSSNIDVSNASPSNINILNLDPAVINILNINILNSATANTGISNINILNQTVGNINILNQTVGNINILNTPITDATYRVTNSGNTAHSYRVALYGNNPNNTPLQLITTKTYASPTSSGCTLVQQNQNVRYSEVSNPLVATTLTVPAADGTVAANDPNILGSDVGNSTIALAPGESAFVTIRGNTDRAGMESLVRQLTPVITAHGGGAIPFAMLLFIQTTAGTLPAAVVGVPYNGSGYQFQAVGGSGTITWTATGTLPTGLTLSPSGLLSGTPSGAGTFTFNVTAGDGSPTPQTFTQAISMTVAARATSTALTLASNPSVVGQVVSATVTVTDTQAGGTASSPTGAVTLSGDPGLSAATCVLASSAPGASACSVTVTPASPGPRTISASYTGTTIHTPSSGSAGLTVNPAATTTGLVSSLNPSTYGAAVTFTAAVSVGAPGAGRPTGTVTFFDGATTIGTGTFNGSGVATFSTSSLSVSPHSITASYAGDTSFNGSTSSAVSQIVNKATSMTVVSAAPNPSTFGQSVTFTATVTGPGGTPTGTVTFLDGATALGTGTLNGSGVATFSTSSLSVATHPITASYAGDTNFNGSTSSAVLQVVNKATSTTVLAAAPNPSTFGQSVTFTATVTGPGGTPGGTVSFLDGATALGTGTLNGSGVATFSTSSLSVAPHPITASYAGDTSFNGSTSSAVSQTVNKATSTTVVSAAPNPSTFGQSVTFTATVAGPGGTPTGTATFHDGATTLGTGTLNGGGVATFSPPSLSVAPHSITATYNGDGSFSTGTSGPYPQVVNKSTSSVQVSASPNPSALGQSVVLTVAVSAVAPGAGTPTGTVSFNDGVTVIGTATLSGGSATFTVSTLLAGSHSIVAGYSGDGSFLSGSSAVFTQTVNKGATSTALVAAPNPSVLSQAVTLTAAVTTTASGVPGPTGSVTFLDGSTAIGTAPLTGSLATLTYAALSIGSHAVTASYAGDANYGGSASTTVTQVVNPPPFTFIGFQTPLATAGTLAAPTSSATASYGNGVPVKYKLLDYLGNNVTDLSSTPLIQAVANSSCSGAPDGPVTLLYSPTTGAKGGSTFRSGSSGFIFNWDTGVVPGPGCYTLVVQLSDGSAAKATNINLK